MVRKSRINELAKAMYDSHKFKKPWEHKDTIEKWHPWMTAQAEAFIKTYEKIKRRERRT